MSKMACIFGIWHAQRTSGENSSEVKCHNAFAHTNTIYVVVAYKVQLLHFHIVLVESARHTDCIWEMKTYLRRRWVLLRPKRHRRRHFPQHIHMVHRHGRLEQVRCEVLIGHRFASPSNGSGCQVPSCHFCAKQSTALDRLVPNRRNSLRLQLARPD